MPQLKKIDLLPVLAILLFALWYAVPSSLFMQPISWKLTGNEVRFVRITPYGDVIANWKSEITLINRDGFECYGSGTSFYQEEPTNTVSYELGDWARRCIEAGPPFTIRQTWQVVLFDIIPLRPTEIIIVVEGINSNARPAVRAIVN
jgi:hypothetical protein